jgi:hypothetical protein
LLGGKPYYWHDSSTNTSAAESRAACNGQSRKPGWGKRFAYGPQGSLNWPALGNAANCGNLCRLEAPQAFRVS